MSSRSVSIVGTLSRETSIITARTGRSGWSRIVPDRQRPVVEARELRERRARVERARRRRRRRSPRRRRRCAARSPRAASDASIRSEAIAVRGQLVADVDERVAAAAGSRQLPAVDEVDVADAAAERGVRDDRSDPARRRCCRDRGGATRGARRRAAAGPRPRPMRSGRDRDRSEEAGAVHLERADRADARRRRARSRGCPCRARAAPRPASWPVRRHPLLDLVALGRRRERVAARIVGKRRRDRSSCRSWSRRGGSGGARAGTGARSPCSARPARGRTARRRRP